MKNPIKYLTSQLSNSEKSYVVNHSFQEVIAVTRCIPESNGLLDTVSFELKYFTDNRFVIQLSHVTSYIRLASKLYGEINPVDINQTIIVTKAKPSLVFVSLFGMSIIIGLIYSYKLIAIDKSLAYLIYPLMIVIIPWLLFWYKRVTEATIRRRFIDYLNKSLNKRHSR